MGEASGHITGLEGVMKYIAQKTQVTMNPVTARKYSLDNVER